MQAGPSSVRAKPETARSDRSARAKMQYTSNCLHPSTTSDKVVVRADAFAGDISKARSLISAPAYHLHSI